MCCWRVNKKVFNIDRLNLICYNFKIMVAKMRKTIRVLKTVFLDGTQAYVAVIRLEKGKRPIRVGGNSPFDLAQVIGKMRLPKDIVLEFPLTAEESGEFTKALIEARNFQQTIRKD